MKYEKKKQTTHFTPRDRDSGNIPGGITGRKKKFTEILPGIMEAERLFQEWVLFRREAGRPLKIGSSGFLFSSRKKATKSSLAQRKIKK